MRFGPVWTLVIGAAKRRPKAVPIYAAAALAEIAGCFAVWAWLRLGPLASARGRVARGLRLAPRAEPRRAFAAYGEVYIAASLLWLWAVEGHRPDGWDLLGAVLRLLGAAVILWAPRGI